jgi:hypothetical protein
MGTATKLFDAKIGVCRMMLFCFFELNFFVQTARSGHDRRFGGILDELGSLEGR